MAQVDPDVSIFDGPGEVRRLLRSIDWAATDLGPVASWSQTLRVTIRTVLASETPLVVNWGPRFVALYNDAYGKQLAGKHPASLGRSSKDNWPDAWNWLGPRLDQVRSHGKSAYLVDERQILNRNGYPEECYFTSSHSPIVDDDGTVGGIFTVTAETTERKLAERRLGLLRKLAEISGAEADSAPQVCLAALQVLESARATAPFAIVLLCRDNGPLRWLADYGLIRPAEGEPGSTALSAFAVPAARVLESVQPEVVTGLRSGWTSAIPPGPLGPLLPDAAVLLPLTVSGRRDPVGVLVVGVNPYRALDEAYQGFFTSVGRQLRVALTDQAAYENERRRVLLEADLDRAKTEFFQNVSHELRTPLTLLLAPLQDLLAESRDQPGSRREDLQAAVRAAERLRLMVDALLDFSGANAGVLAPDKRPTDLGRLTLEVAGMFRSAAEHAGLGFDVAVPPGLVTAMVDKAMWSTMVTNLLSNAVKYTPGGHIQVRLRSVGSNAVLTVTDTGVGISEAEQALVFERFGRASTVRSGQGAGIGLALVVDLVRLHEGRIELNSKPGQGTTFTLTVPIGSVPAAAADQPRQTSPQAGPAQGRVLLVEDEVDLRGYLSRLLTGDGWAVEAVPDAETALTAARSAQTPPDVVLTDVMLPGHSGLHLVRRLRQAPSTARLPIIVLTGRGGTEAVNEGLAAGADDYITKPFSSRELLARVRANHELHRLREQAIGLAEARADQLKGALDTNRVIGNAVGIVMATYQLTAEQGFRLLTAASQNTNTKLRDIAAAVVDTGTLPFRPTVVDDLVIRAAGRDRTG